MSLNAFHEFCRDCGLIGEGRCTVSECGLIWEQVGADELYLA